MRTKWVAVLIAGALLAPAAARAQVGWESPMLLPPMSEPGFGIFLADVHLGQLGVIGTWRARSWNYGLRFGIAEDGGPDDDIAVLGGVDFTGRINRASADFPLDVDWIFGAGASAGDDVLLSFPLGLTAGHTFRGEGATFIPYISPRIVLDAFFGGEGDDDSDLDLGLAVDLGLDLRLLGGVTVRFGASLGDREAVAVGLVF